MPAPDRALVRRAAGLTAEAPIGGRAVVDGWCDLAANEFRWWLGLSMLPRSTLSKGHGAIARALDTPQKTAFRLTVALELAGYVKIDEPAPPKGARGVSLLREPWWAGVGRFHKAPSPSTKKTPTMVVRAPLPGVPLPTDGFLFGKRKLERPP